MGCARWFAVAATAVIGLGVIAGRAHADPRIEKADRLFDEARALLGSDLALACAKFDESLRYNPAAIGTLLNVALCDEKLGRFASAVAKFSEARDRAREQSLAEHVRAAEQHIAELEPSVPHVALQLTETLPETKIVLDDRVVALDAIADIAVDPGEREIVVSAPGRLTYRATFVIARAERKDVVIPALARSVTITSSRRRIGQIATFAGGGALATAAGLGIYGRRLWNQQFDLGRCETIDGDHMCSPQGQTQVDRARTLGNVGTVVGITGIAVAGLGVYLWLRSPASSNHARDRVTVAPRVGPDGVGLVATGRF